jgi:uroporphyrin-III C-methyltransferase/precorrin-2 dehydrogenase/sirohydrochlorin ferrochelatase
MHRLAFFPISFAVADRPIALIGGGEKALRKLRLLARSAATIHLHATEPSLALRNAAAKLRAVLHSETPTEADLRHCALIVVACDDAAEETNAARLARSVGVPVNVVDRLDLSDFTFPAIVDRSPIAIAIATDGTAPVLAQKLRSRIESMLPPRFGLLGVAAASLRDAVRRRLPDADARRRFWSAFFDGPAADAAITGDIADARRIGLRELDAVQATPPRGSVALVGAGPGAADLLTLRAQRLLQEADALVHDALVTEDVLSMARRDATRIPVGKRKGRPSTPQCEINALLIRLAGEGRRVVRLKSGDPTVFARAGEEIDSLRASGVSVEIVPGVTAALAAAADLCLSLTHRQHASELIFATGHEAEPGRSSNWARAAAAGATLALYMSRSVADRVARLLLDAGLSPATPAFAVERAGQPDRKIYSGNVGRLEKLADACGSDGPTILLVGQALTVADITIADQTARNPRQAA